MMKRKLLLNTLALALTGTALAVVPDMPKPKGNQFAVQLFRVDSPRPFDKEKFKQDSESILELFNAKENYTKAYPTIYAELGKPAVNDQTKSMMLPTDYNVVNGEPVAVEALQHIGVRAEITIHDYRNDTATFNLKFHHQEIKGYDEYLLKGGKSVRIPIFETRKVDTDLSQVLGSWVVVGGIESSTGEKTSTAYYIIRVTRPIAGFARGRNSL